MKKLTKMLIASLPLAALCACSSDDFDSDSGENGIASKTEMRYLKVCLANPGSFGTRAEGEDPGNTETSTINYTYDNGTEAENKIRTLNFYFYDADKNYHSESNVTIDNAVSPTTSTDEWVSGFYTTNVPVQLIQGEKMPSYVMCIVNAVSSSQYKDKSLYQAQETLLSDIYGATKDGDTRYFAMSNSVYYGIDPVSNTNTEELIMATPITPDYLKSETDMTKIETGSTEDIAAVTLNIYVERYAAKVTFNLKDNSVKDFTSANNVKITFIPGKWGINAYEKDFYLIKSYRTEAGDQTFESYTQLNSTLFEGWNRPDHFRSFWSRTPAYYTNNYPVVNDDIKEAAGNTYNVFYQTYKSAQYDVNSSQYMKETTVKGAALTKEDMPSQYIPLAAVPSVVLTGTYNVNGTQPKTFYTYQKDSNGTPYIYAANDGDITDDDGKPIQTIHDKMLSSQTIVLSKTDGSYTPVRKEAIADNSPFTVVHPEKAVRGNLKVGGDMVTLQMTKKDTGFWYYDSSDGTYKEINGDDDLNKVNLLLYQNVGGAHAFIAGKAFFTAPIQHWGWYRKDNNNKNQPMKDWVWEEMKTGDFGVVRNHVYTIAVDEISGIGTGIINEDDYLLPPSEKVGYEVKFKVNIQKWATLPTQSWTW